MVRSFLKLYKNYSFPFKKLTSIESNSLNRNRKSMLQESTTLNRTIFSKFKHTVYMQGERSLDKEGGSMDMDYAKDM